MRAISQFAGKFANLEVATQVRMNKTNNPFFGRVVKKQKLNVRLLDDYSKRVNNNLEKEHKERDFVASAPKVGEKIAPCIYYNSNTGKTYLMVECFENSVLETQYLLDGNPVSKEVIQEYLPTRRDNSSQGLDNAVKVVTYGMDSIQSITVGGKKIQF